jgi:amidophosphoribosyltransferase
LKKLPGKSAIGHVRYSTAGSSELKNAQPFVVDYYKGSLAIAHNGNLSNAPLIKSDLESKGSIFQSNMDTEVIVHLIARCKGKSFVERVVHALKQVEGAYSLLFLEKKCQAGSLRLQPLVRWASSKMHPSLRQRLVP